MPLVWRMWIIQLVVSLTEQLLVGNGCWQPFSTISNTMYISLFFSVAIFSEHRPVQVVPQLNFCIEVFYSKCRIYHCAYVCLSTGPRWPGGAYLPAMDFCLFGAILNLKAFCFGAIPDIMIELIFYGSVPQSRQSWQWLSGIEIKLLGGLWLLAKKMCKMDSCLRGAIL